MVALNSAEQVWLISLRATLVANAYLEAEIERLTEAISTGFARGRLGGVRLPGNLENCYHYATCRPSGRVPS
jgi:hypothetical protein